MFMLAQDGHLVCVRQVDRMEQNVNNRQFCWAKPLCDITTCACAPRPSCQSVSPLSSLSSRIAIHTHARLLRLAVADRDRLKFLRRLSDRMHGRIILPDRQTITSLPGDADGARRRDDGAVAVGRGI